MITENRESIQGYFNMKPIKTLLTLFLAVTVLLSGCAGSSQAESPETQATPSQETTQPEKETTATPDETEKQASVEGKEVQTVLMGSDSGQLVFVPETLEIEPGETVKWVMNKVPPHNVIFEGDRVPNANKALAKEISHKKLLSTPGASYQTTFEEDIPSGSYPYYCEPHRAAGMAGKIIIKD